MDFAVRRVKVVLVGGALFLAALVALAGGGTFVPPPAAGLVAVTGVAAGAGLEAPAGSTDAGRPADEGAAAVPPESAALPERAVPAVNAVPPEPVAALAIVALAPPESARGAPASPAAAAGGEPASTSPGARSGAAPPASGSAQQTPGPVEAVTAFYAAISQGRLDNALLLWSPRMRATYPPPVYLYDRFAATRQLTVRRAEVVASDAAAGRATVAVMLSEVSSRSAFNRTWQGTWYLVRTPAGWLLDQPSFRV